MSGPDCRIHAIGDRLIATLIQSGDVDYRFARRGKNMDGAEVPRELKARLADVTRRCDLNLAGWDLKWHADRGEWAVLEVNRMPAFNLFDHEGGAGVAHEIVAWAKIGAGVT
ncbi:MAG: hypothetical protein ACYCVE_15575 [Gemmatimonadaceae bacterium]